MFPLTVEQIEAREQFRRFMQTHITPNADRYDKEQTIPDSLIKTIGDQGYWGTFISREYGGLEMDMITYGLLCEEFAKASMSVLSLITVHGMVSAVISRWGSPRQREQWLGNLASGEIVAAFALSEPEIGSDARNVTVRAEQAKGHWYLTGRKKWISFGQKANVFLVIARCKDKSAAFLVERGTPGFTTTPITGMLGFKSAMLAELHLDHCAVSPENMIGSPGFGLSHVAGTGLDLGRYAIAWGGVGLSQGCLDASIAYANTRKQFGACLSAHQLIQKKIADMITNTQAARCLCLNAGTLKESLSPESVLATCMAKYFSARTALACASDAVQIHGANGCSDAYPVERYFRDAKILEIIEGSHEMQQLMIAKHALSGVVS